MMERVAKAIGIERIVIPVILCIFITAIGFAHAAETTTSDWPQNDWSVASPEEEGMDPGALGVLVQWAKSDNADSLLVIRHGKIVLDAYYAPYRAGIRHDLRSITKSFISTLTAIAIRDHFLDSVDHLVLDLFQDKAVANIDDRKESMRIQHLLDMSSGFEWNEDGYGPNATLWNMYKSSDATKFVLDQPMKTAPGHQFYYNSGNPYILSALLTRLTGQNALQFARKELFGPLGISNVEWGKPDQQNVIDGEARLHLLPHDMAKLGYLYLHQGQWRGAQMIPSSWVERARNGAIDAGHGFSYGNLWWSMPPKKAYMALGRHNQKIVVIPEADVVAVLTASLPDGVNIPNGQLIDRIVESIKADKNLSVDVTGTSLLNAALQSAAKESPDTVTQAPSLASQISGKTIDFSNNPLHLKSLTLNLIGPNPSWSASSDKSADDKTIEVDGGPLGLNGIFPDEPFREHVPIVKGRWLSATTFEAKSRMLDQSITARWIFRFNGEKVELHFEDGDGFNVDIQGTAEH